MLTQEQIQAIAKQRGDTVVSTGSSLADDLQSIWNAHDKEHPKKDENTIYADDKPIIGGPALDAIKNTGKTYAEAVPNFINEAGKNDASTSENPIIRTGENALAATASGVDTLFAPLTGAVKAASDAVSSNKAVQDFTTKNKTVGAILDFFGHGSDKLNSWAEQHPEAARNLSSLLTVGTAALGGETNVAKKPLGTIESIANDATNMGKEYASTVKEAVPKVVDMASNQANKAINYGEKFGKATGLVKDTGTEMNKAIEATMPKLTKDERIELVKKNGATRKPIEDELKPLAQQARNFDSSEAFAVDAAKNPGNTMSTGQLMNFYDRAMRSEELMGVEKSGLLGKIHPKTTYQDVQRAKSLLDENGKSIVKGNFIKDSEAINKRINNISEYKIKPFLSENPNPYNLSELDTYLKQAKAPRAFTSSKEQMSLYNNVKDDAVRIADRFPKTNQGLWEARQMIDDMVKKEYPTIFNTPQHTAVRRAVLDVRNSINEFVGDNLGNADMSLVNKINDFINTAKGRGIDIENPNAVKAQFEKETGTQPIPDGVFKAAYWKGRLKDLTNLNESLESVAENNQHLLNTTNVRRIQKQYPNLWKYLLYGTGIAGAVGLGSVGIVKAATGE